MEKIRAGLGFFERELGLRVADAGFLEKRDTECSKKIELSVRTRT